MSSIAHLILLVLALVLFGVAAWQQGSPTWNRLLALGLMALTASMIPW